MNITMAGIDLAKRQLSVHGADQIGQVLLRREKRTHFISTVCSTTRE